VDIDEVPLDRTGVEPQFDVWKEQLAIFQAPLLLRGFDEFIGARDTVVGTQGVSPTIALAIADSQEPVS
jgi:hypothetical protein